MVWASAGTGASSCAVELSWLRLLQWGERRQNLLSLLLGITQAIHYGGLNGTWVYSTTFSSLQNLNLDRQMVLASDYVCLRNFSPKNKKLKRLSKSLEPHQRIP